MLARQPGELVARGGDPFNKATAILAGADIVVANLECVVATGGRPAEKHFTFRAHPRCLPVLAKHLDAVSLANNHTGDFGKPAFVEMLGRIEGAGLHAFGAGRDEAAAHAPLVLRREKVCGSRCWHTTRSIPAMPRPAPARPGSPGSTHGGQPRTSGRPAPAPTW